MRPCILLNILSTLYQENCVIYFVLQYISHMLLVNVNQKAHHKENFACRFPHTQQHVPTKREKTRHQISIQFTDLFNNAVRKELRKVEET